MRILKDKSANLVGRSVAGSREHLGRHTPPAEGVAGKGSTRGSSESLREEILTPRARRREVVGAEACDAREVPPLSGPPLSPLHHPTRCGRTGS